jgi:hypothetical protein
VHWRGVVCSGVVWCGVVWCGVVWCGVVWSGVAWCGVLCCAVVGYAVLGYVHGWLTPVAAAAAAAADRVLVQLCACLGVQEQEDVKLPLRLLLQLLKTQDAPAPPGRHARKPSTLGMSMTCRDLCILCRKKFFLRFRGSLGDWHECSTCLSCYYMNCPHIPMSAALQTNAALVFVAPTPAM